jgi:acyl-CoA reductase-like NAD-dependent aldehyde dehydrogenase
MNQKYRGRQPCKIGTCYYAFFHDNMRPKMKIWQDEIFAPVLSMVQVKKLRGSN